MFIIKFTNFTSKTIFLYPFYRLFVCVLLAIFDTSESTSFHCEYPGEYLVEDPVEYPVEYQIDQFDYGSLYNCDVQNYINIISLDAAQVDAISGTHKAGYNNDNVENLNIKQGKIHYFPRGLNKIFKNLKAIEISGTGLKEIHQSDLKDFPQLKKLWLATNDLEILEENLFEFNPNLELVSLSSNKISLIDPNVFSKLTSLNALYLGSNTCINMGANNPTEVKNIIKTVKAQCINSDFPLLEQKVKNLEIESENLNFENFKEKLENLENEIKKSKFPNTFHRRLQDLKVVQDKKALEEISKFVKCSALELKVDNIAATLKDLKAQTGNGTCSNKDSDQCKAFKEDLRNQTETIGKISNRTEALDTKLKILDENVQNSRTASTKEFENLRNEVKTDYAGILAAMTLRTDKIEEQIKKQNKIFEEKLTEIMKAMHIEDEGTKLKTKHSENTGKSDKIFQFFNL